MIQLPIGNGAADSRLLIRLAHRVTHEKADVRTGFAKRRRIRRMRSLDNLPLPSAFFYGPKWKRLCGVREVPIAEIDPLAATYHRPGRKLLIFSFEDDVRELLFVGREEMRPGVFAEW